MKKISILDFYNILYNHFGPRHWWPADTPFEVIIGAILTQNTAWVNVEKAILNLKNSGNLSFKGLYNLPESELSYLIKPAGYFNIKAKRLKGFINFLHDNYEGKLDNLFSLNIGDLRNTLLSIYGIGEETADSIILYAAEKPVFVVDAYTKRIFSRHGYFEENLPYQKVQEFFHKNLPVDIKLYNEYHALIVELGKNYCKKKMKCEKCPVFPYVHLRKFQ